MLFLDYICARCGSTASWRNSLIAKYPNDVTRNTTARDLLRTIAVMSEDDVPAETKAALTKVAGSCPSRARILPAHWIPLCAVFARGCRVGHHRACAASNGVHQRFSGEYGT